MDGFDSITYTQKRRVLRMETPLGTDVLIAGTLTGEEAMSEGFSYTLTAFATSQDAGRVTPEALVGKAVTLMLVLEDDSERYINGYVSALRPLGVARRDGTHGFELTLVSWLWFLGQSSDCRIFQDQTLPDIIQGVCGEWQGYGRARMDVQRSHPTQTIIVQYNETTLNFIHRLARQAGLAYYFTHDNGSHTVHFTDRAKRLPALAPSTVPLRSAETAEHDALQRWTHQRRLRSGDLTQRTYNYLSPDAPVEAQQGARPAVRELPHAGDLRRYVYTEAYEDKSAGRTDTALTLAQGNSDHAIVQASGNCRHLLAGHVFTVASEPSDSTFADEGRAFVLTRVSLNVTNTAEGHRHACMVEAVPEGQMVHPDGERPRIASLQTAVVTGQEPDTVYTDHDKRQLGRIKAQFHWDREGRYTPDSSCWLRVMQTGGGSGFAGFYALPRVGSEVVVAFENGNPDRPFVLGTLPHPDAPPPYGDRPTCSGIKTRSFNTSAETSAFNELRFDDKTGNEEVFFQAERDYNAHIKRNASEAIDNDAAQQVGNNLSLRVGNNETCEVGKDLTITAGSSITLQVGGNTITIDSSGITITGGAVTISGNPTSIN